jgi:mannosyltransferase OCH1-like enzyme
MNGEAKIPKIIHYCWFGPDKKPILVNKCIESWQKHNPDWEILEWSESNFDVNGSPFTKKMYAQKKWAFVADYVRLYELEKFGGIYLDTDMLLLKSLNNFLRYDLVLGEEKKDMISSGMVGAVPMHPYITACKNYYDNNPKVLKTIPVIMNDIHKNFQKIENEIVLPYKTFYPYDMYEIKNYNGQDQGADVYGVHMWNYSWGHPLNKFFKKIGIYRFGKSLAEMLGIKKILKKLLGFV